MKYLNAKIFFRESIQVGDLADTLSSRINANLPWFARKVFARSVGASRGCFHALNIRRICTELNDWEFVLIETATPNTTLDLGLGRTNEWPPVSNCLRIFIDARLPSVAERLVQTLDAIAAALPVRFAFIDVLLPSDLEGPTNLDRPTSDLINGLPNVFWYTYFGQEYIAMIGEHKFRTASVYRLDQIGEGVRVIFCGEPEYIFDDELETARVELKRNLGACYFQEPLNKKRLAITPDFYADQRQRDEERRQERRRMAELLGGNRKSRLNTAEILSLVRRKKDGGKQS